MHHFETTILQKLNDRVLANEVTYANEEMW